MRLAVIAEVAAELGLSPDASLGELADAAPDPWSDLLHQHRKAFLMLTSEIRALADVNRDLLTAGQRAARETMLAFTLTRSVACSSARLIGTPPSSDTSARARLAAAVP